MTRHRTASMPTKKFERRKAPILEQGERGPILLCPFCHPPHPLTSASPAACGTILEVNAVQRMYQSVKCALCGSSDGTLIKIGDLYRHTHNCTPNQELLPQQPKLSKSAAICSRLGHRFARLIYGFTGKMLLEIKRDGKTVGFSWK